MENKKPFKDFFNVSQIPNCYFGVRFMLGMLTLIGASWVFVGIAEDIMSGGPLTIVDTQLAAWFHAPRPCCLPSSCSSYPTCKAHWE